MLWGFQWVILTVSSSAPPPVTPLSPFCRPILIIEYELWTLWTLIWFIHSLPYMQALQTELSNNKTWLARTDSPWAGKGSLLFTHSHLEGTEERSAQAQGILFIVIWKGNFLEVIQLTIFSGCDRAVSPLLYNRSEWSASMLCCCDSKISLFHLCELAIHIKEQFLIVLLYNLYWLWQGSCFPFAVDIDNHIPCHLAHTALLYILILVTSTMQMAAACSSI